MTAKKTPVDEVSVVDQLAEDAAAPVEYPEGAPALTPYLKIRPRSKRGDFKRKFAEFEQLKVKVLELQSSGVLDPDSKNVTEGDRMRASADMDDMLQKMDELLAIAAVDDAVYRGWSDGLEDDNDLTAVFNVYMRRTQPGEASSSAS